MRTVPETVRKLFIDTKDLHDGTSSLVWLVCERSVPDDDQPDSLRVLDNVPDFERAHCEFGFPESECLDLYKMEYRQ